MMNDNPSYASVNSTQSILWFLTLTYTVIIILANWFAPRLIHIFNINTDAGTLIFPFTFLLSDLITEVYGFKYARRAVWCGLLFNALFVMYAQLIIHLPGPNFESNNRAFDAVLTVSSRIILASAISYILSEPLNSFVMAKLKIRMKGHYLSLRFILSTFFAAGVDSFIFTTIAFYGSMENANLLIFILTMWLVKICIEVIGLPISVKLARKLKKIEQLDIYDRHTDFNLFNLDIHYLKSDNEFSKNRT